MKLWHSTCGRPSPRSSVTARPTEFGRNARVHAARELAPIGAALARPEKRHVETDAQSTSASASSMPRLHHSTAASRPRKHEEP